MAKKKKKATKKKATKKKATKKKATKKKVAKKKAKKKATKKKATKKKAKKKTTKKKATKKKAKKKATKKKATKRKAKKKKSKTKRKPNAAFMRPLKPSNDLAAVVGSAPIPRTQVVKKLWAYIKKKGLQDSKNRRNINADAALKKVFNGRSTVSMFEMTKYVSKHLK